MKEVIVRSKNCPQGKRVILLNADDAELIRNAPDGKMIELPPEPDADDTAESSRKP